LNKAILKYPSNSKKPGKTKAFFICLIIASFLWLIHSLNTVYTHTVKVPVVFKNLPQNKKPLSHLPETLALDLKASGLRLVLILMKKPFKPFEIDFNTLKSVNRNQNYILSASQLNFNALFNFETQVKHINPDTLYFSEKSGYQKMVPVKVPLYLKCKEGYGFIKPTINPSFVSVWGDTTTVDNIDTIYTQALTLNNLNKNFNGQLELIRPNQYVYTSTNEASVFIEVAKLIEQTITIPISDIKKSYYKQINMYPSRVKVKYTCVQDGFNAEDTALFKAMINSEKINKQSNKCPVFISTYPGNITIMDIEPKEVEILILKK
jgi:hypothetical protein